MRKLNAVENVITSEKSLKCNICLERIEDIMLIDCDKEWRPEKFEQDDQISSLIEGLQKITLEQTIAEHNHGRS